MTFPNKFKFLSDDCILELMKEITEPKRVKNGYVDTPTGFAKYVYKTGFYFKGSEITFSDKQIEIFLRRERIIIL